MACFHPLSAWQARAGAQPVFKRMPRWKELRLPCGQCIGCRLERSRQWAVRCVHESSLWSENRFITLTYDDDNLPADGSLEYEHFQKFMKRLRKQFKGVDEVEGDRPLRFYMCGEYGDLNQRPHYHALLFNHRFPDEVVHSRTLAGSIVYRSASLERLWPFGFSSIGEVNFESAAYVARYCMKKITGEDAEAHYGGRSPEFTRMSLKPGIGGGWFEKWKGDVFPHDYVVSRGREVSVPRYYDRLLEKEDSDLLLDIKAKREAKALECAPDNTPERLRSREVVTTARLGFYQRNL